MYAMMALRADGTKVYLPVRDEDLALYEEAQARLASETLPLPETSVRPGHNTDQARGYNYTQWRDFFNARQLLCLVVGQALVVPYIIEGFEHRNAGLQYTLGHR